MWGTICFDELCVARLAVCGDSGGNGAWARLSWCGGLRGQCHLLVLGEDVTSRWGGDLYGSGREIGRLMGEAGLGLLTG